MKVLVVYRSDKAKFTVLPSKVSSIAKLVSHFDTADGTSSWTMELKGSGRFGWPQSLRLAFRMIQFVIHEHAGHVKRVQILFDEED